MDAINLKTIARLEDEKKHLEQACERLEKEGPKSKEKKIIDELTKQRDEYKKKYTEY